MNEGRSAKEARKIVEADLARLGRIEEIWGELREEQQNALIDEAEAMHSENEMEAEG